MHVLVRLGTQITCLMVSLVEVAHNVYDRYRIKLGIDFLKGILINRVTPAIRSI
jgi:hypothetical protein